MPPRPPRAMGMMEVDKVDPRSLLAPVQTRIPIPKPGTGLPPPPEDDDVPFAPPSPADLQRIANQAPPVPQQPAVIADKPSVPNSVLGNLLAEYGIVPRAVYDRVLDVNGKPMTVTIRRPEAPDTMWAALVLVGMSPEDSSMLTTEIGRNNTTYNLVACRCLQAINGTPVWDLLGKRAEIMALRPKWDGATVLGNQGIPDTILGSMARSFYEQFTSGGFPPDFIGKLADEVMLVGSLPNPTKGT